MLSETTISKELAAISLENCVSNECQCHSMSEKLTDITEVTELSAQLLGRMEVRYTVVEMRTRWLQVHARCCKSYTCINRSYVSCS